MLFTTQGSRMGSVVVPLDRALLSSYGLSIVTIMLSVMVWLQFAMQILTAGSEAPNLPLLCLTLAYLGPQWCPCQMTSHDVQGAWVWEMDRETDRWTYRPLYGNICRNRRHYRFERRRLIMIIAGQCLWWWHCGHCVSGMGQLQL